MYLSIVLNGYVIRFLVRMLTIGVIWVKTLKGFYQQGELMNKNQTSLTIKVIFSMKVVVNKNN